MWPAPTDAERTRIRCAIASLVHRYYAIRKRIERARIAFVFIDHVVRATCCASNEDGCWKLTCENFGLAFVFGSSSEKVEAREPDEANPLDHKSERDRNWNRSREVACDTVCRVACDVRLFRLFAWAA